MDVLAPLKALVTKKVSGSFSNLSQNGKSKECLNEEDKCSKIVLPHRFPVHDEEITSKLSYDYAPEILDKYILKLIPQVKRNHVSQRDQRLEFHIYNFKFFEAIIVKMQDVRTGIRRVKQTKGHKIYTDTVKGYQIIGWLGENGYSIRESTSISSELFNLGLLISVVPRDSLDKNFCTDSFIFQNYYMWPSKLPYASKEEYMNYLFWRHNSSKIVDELETYEKQRLNTYLMSGVGSLNDMKVQLEARKILLSKVPKNIKWKFLIQQKSFWSLRYPPQSHKNEFTRMFTLNDGKGNLTNEESIVSKLSYEKALEWYNNAIESYTYQLNIPITPYKESCKSIILRVIAAEKIDFLANKQLAVQNPWTEKVTDRNSMKSFVVSEEMHAYLWKTSFQELLRSPMGIKSFGEFLRSEFSEENLEFYLECQRISSYFSEKTFNAMASEIYYNFVSPDSPKEINITYEQRQIITNNIRESLKNDEKIPRDIFDNAAEEIYTLMSNDPYTRFCTYLSDKYCLSQ